jgi:hypothetical protein
MTITTRQAQELRKRIRDLVKAEVEHSWKGSDRAQAFTDYDEQLRVARRRLNTFIGSLLHDDGRVQS